MTDYLEFAVLGLGLSTAYIGISSGLLMVHRATGIINFAQGAMAMWGAYVYAQLRIDGTLVLPVFSISLGQPTGVPVAIVLGLVMAALLGLLVHVAAFAPMRNAPALAQVVVSVGVMIALQALVIIRFGSTTIVVDSIFPDGTLAVGGSELSVRDLCAVGVMIVIAGFVWAYLRLTLSGVATCAAAENERAAVLMGYNPSSLARKAMLLGAVVSTSGVILASGVTGLQPGYYTLLVVPALAVLLAARLESVPSVVGGAVLLGAFQSVITLVVLRPGWPQWAQSGLNEVVPFLVVLVILLAFGRRLPARGSISVGRLPEVVVPRLRPIQLTGAVVVVGALLTATSGVWRFGLTYSLILMLLSLSYVVVTGYLGQISLAQSAFAGSAGFVLSKVSTNWGWDFIPAVLFGVSAAVILGCLVALPALRIRGSQLAIVTIAAGLAIERFVFNNYSLTPPTGNPIPSPTLFGLDLGVRSGSDISRLPFSLFVLAVVAVVVVLFIRIASGETGQVWLAVRSNERAAASVGINVNGAKLIGFAVSSGIAGLAGCLIGFSAGQLSAESFTVFVGLQVLAVSYLGGITSVGGAAIAGLLGPLGLIYVVFETSFELGDYYALISGLALVAGAMLNPSGAAGEFRHVWIKVRGVRPPRPPSASPQADQAVAARG